MSNKKIIFAGLVFVLFASVVFTANAASKVSLSVQKQGKGVVTSDDGKINCGKDCSEIYYSGGSVTLNAVSAEGFTFEKWTGNACVAFGASSKDDTRGSCSVSLDYNKNTKLTAKAHFKKNDKGGGDGNTTSTATDGGTSSSLATDIGTTSSAYAGKPGEALSYTLKVNKSGKGFITDESEKGQGIYCGTDCSEKYGAGTEVKLRATPDNGYVFEKFVPAKECVSPSYGNFYEAYCYTIMDKNKTITAVFKKSPPGTTKEGKSSSTSSSQKSSSSSSSSYPKGSSSF